jgi:hypothetical protein
VRVYRIHAYVDTSRIDLSVILPVVGDITRNARQNSLLKAEFGAAAA